jgi:hypothetical protein
MQPLAPSDPLLLLLLCLYCSAMLKVEQRVDGGQLRLRDEVRVSLPEE